MHCEAQVLHFVLRYLASTQLDAEAAASICSQVKGGGEGWGLRGVLPAGGQAHGALLQV